MGAKYGQHFLINRHAAERIVDSLRLMPEETVLEIGPGRGALTSLLLEKAGRVVAVEIDPEMVDLLRGKFGQRSNLVLMAVDILAFDLDAVDALAPGAPFKIVGNLPYNLTSPILRKLSGWKNWSAAWVMVQKEVGDRMAADIGSGDYGALTVGMSLTSKVEKVFDLSETSFSPPPKVRSSVVKLTRRDQPLTDDIDAVQRVIQAAFQQRRKTILNSLSHGLSLEKKDVQLALARVGIEEITRPDRIPVDAFIALSRNLELNRLRRQ